MKGKNFVELQGTVNWPKMSFTANGTPRFQATLSIPVEYESGGEMRTSQNYVPITAWAEIAQSMEGLTEGTPLKVHGRINIRNYDSTCKECQAPMKRKWAEVVVDNYMELLPEDTD